LFSSRRRHTRFSRDWSSDVCSSDLIASIREAGRATQGVKLIRLDAGDEIAAITNLNDREEDEEIEAEDAVIVNESEAEVVETSRSEERRVGKECRSRRRKHGSKREV